MTEQRSDQPAPRVAVATTRPKRNQSTVDNAYAVEQLAQKSKREQGWRKVIVTSLIIFGCGVGYNLGDLFIGTITQAQGSEPGTFVYALQNAFTNIHGLKFLDQVLFVGLGGLAAFLISSSSYVTLSSLTDNVRGLGTNDKIALFLGSFEALAFTVLFAQLWFRLQYYGWMLTALTFLIMMYVCTSAMISMKDSFRFTRGHLPDGESLPMIDGVEPTSRQIKILDTNVIIDGRISDVCRAGFIEGTIYIPGFVLDELQHIADSSDSLKRARGRRGLDILNAMRAQMSLLVRTLDSRADFPPGEEVDSKLVRLAGKLGGAIVTNDFNLNKVAELQGVPVLNINELANALKPVVLPGEEMRVMVIKEGKEMNQGVGYLDDGTMIVIDGARRRIGETLEVTVSSVLQTAAGKMIFATIRQGYEDGPDADNSAGGPDTGPRSYPGGRPRRTLRD